MNDKILLAVNGTLMRGLGLNHNMLAAKGEFVREDRTDACYRIWTINDRHPGMLRVKSGGVAVSLEVWELPMANLGALLLSEPGGLSIGKVVLADGSEVLGVLAEPWLVEGQKEITASGGWREYTGHHYTP
ncbi:glutamyl-tRNA amidotransferase [Caballeronia sp. ATUFL_M1_KS5A]|uniref:allophanate hydrolase-related protein n=1 Tax=Caballeronia sp. ATUFL_M1_KS5A TaxID=2921778 RepID=UPI002028A05A|nr:glutamyl-tRNA amidotransferase [Caballeronia sp. ATUFL_M1_KS5A]